VRIQKQDKASTRKLERQRNPIIVPSYNVAPITGVTEQRPNKIKQKPLKLAPLNHR